jgi:hypothetical protein
MVEQVYSDDVLIVEAFGGGDTAATAATAKALGLPEI